MSFLIRAALVIGVLSYLAAARQGAGPGASLETARLRTAAEMTGSLSTLAAALPPEARAAALRVGADGLAHHFADPPPSADTLSPSDRLPPWRGGGGR